MPASTDRKSLLSEIFELRFGGMPELFARAPGRVDLMGSHTDFNLGFVLTMPISRDTWIAARRRGDRRVQVYSANLNSGSCFSLDDIQPEGGRPWANYIRAVAAMLQERRLDLAGFDAVIHSTVPIGSGLSSSAALECAAAIAFQALGGWQLEPAGMARLCQRAENRFVGVQCGILDQYTSCLGRESCALLLDCRDLSNRPVSIADGIRVVICDTGARRELAGSEYGMRRAQCEEAARRLGVGALREAELAQLAALSPALPAEVVKRARFIFEENERVLLLVEALPRDDRQAIASLCAASYRGARDLYEICSPPMERMLEAMLAAPGVIGARQAGAGFGGCMVAFVDCRQTAAFAASVSEAYTGTTGLAAEIYPVQAAAGAGLVR